MPDKQPLLSRLSMIKYMYEKGLIENTKPKPLCIGSIFMLYSAIELFLHLILEHYNISDKPDNLPDCWEIIDKHIEGKMLSQKEPIMRFHKARLAFIRHGTIPSKIDFDLYQAKISFFFNENCRQYFDIDFDRLNLLGLISNKALSSMLADAMEFNNQNNDRKAMELIALVFALMLEKFPKHKLIRPDQLKFKIDYINKFTSEAAPPERIPVKAPLYLTIEYNVPPKIRDTEELFIMIDSGLDTKQYTTFRNIAPLVSKNSSGQYLIQHKKQDIEYTKDEVDFCINFCIDSYFRLISFKKY